MADEEISKIRETARKQIQAERSSVELLDVMSSVAKELKDDCKSAESVKEKRMALEEIRKVSKDLQEQTEDQRKISEFPLEELWDELIRLVERKEAQRTAE